MAFSIEADDAPPIQNGVPSLVDTPECETILESAVHDRFDVILFAPGVMLTDGKRSPPPRFRARAEFIRRFTARGGVVIALESNALHFATLTTSYNKFLADAAIPRTHTCGYDIPNAARLVDQRTASSPRGSTVLGDDFLPRSGFARDATAGIERPTILDAVCLDCSGPNRPLIVLGSPHAGLVTGADLPEYDMLPVPAAYNALGGGVRINFAAWMLDCDDFEAEELDTNLCLIEQTIHAGVKWYGPRRRPSRRWGVGARCVNHSAAPGCCCADTTGTLVLLARGVFIRRITLGRVKAQTKPRVASVTRTPAVRGDPTWGR